MAAGLSMFGGVWQKLEAFITGIFALIPQFLFFLYTCFGSLLDFLQYLIRKIAGLDVYYVNGQPQTGDIILNFVRGILGIDKSPAYSAISTVFWSLIIFGLILIVLTTIFSVIKAHFNYDAKKSHPMAIVGKSLKSLALFAIVPLTCVFGLYLSSVVLKTLDEITNPGGSSTIQEYYKNSNANFDEVFQSGKTSTGTDEYTSFDFFGSAAYTGSQTFSGLMFQIAAQDCNRVRRGTYSVETAGTTWSDFGVFNSTAGGGTARSEDVAKMIDVAFANCLTLKNTNQSASITLPETYPLISSLTYLESGVWYFGLINVNCFSKFNVGLVWYYYDLWSFNFLLGFIGIAACLGLMVNIFFGVIGRLVSAMGLFLVYPPLIGISPLDEGGAMKKWTKEFMGNILMAIGAIIGLNIVMLLLPFFQNIALFESEILNNLMDMFFVIVALATVKKIMGLLSDLIGAKNADKEGEGLKKGVAGVAVKGAESSARMAKVGVKVASVMGGPAGLAMSAIKAKSEATAAKRKNTEYDRKLEEGGDEELSLDDYNDKLNEEFSNLESETNNENQKSSEDTERFRNALQSETQLMGNRKDRISPKLASGFAKNHGNLDDKELGQDLFKEFVDEYNQGMSDIGSSDAENKDELREELRKNLVAKYSERFNNENKHAKQAAEAKEKYDKLNQTRKLDGYKLKQSKSFMQRVARPESALGKSLLNIAGSTFKLAGSTTQLSGAFKKLGDDTKVVDLTKDAMQSFYQAVGATTELERAKKGLSKLSTSKQKKDAEDEEEKEYRGNVDALAANMSSAYLATTKLVQSMSKWAKNRDSGKPVETEFAKEADIKGWMKSHGGETEENIRKWNKMANSNPEQLEKEIFETSIVSGMRKDEDEDFVNYLKGRFDWWQEYSQKHGNSATSRQQFRNEVRAKWEQDMEDSERGKTIFQNSLGRGKKSRAERKKQTGKNQKK